MSQNRTAQTGLTAAMALLAYLPFESVAKGSLLVCVTIFILDPFPLSRIYALGSVVVVQLLAKARNAALAAQERAAAEEGQKDNNGVDARKEK
mmetsp:Transcript_8196/g.13560  ORF Transcript_8196/g.13560 Transcript_8196/m.13560 type:complete len:93 (-) Transcript_8196:114-392(-)